MYARFRLSEQQAAPASASASDSPPKTFSHQPTNTLQFINSTAHPQATISAGSAAIGNIRSHVAKKAHATRRKEKERQRRVILSGPRSDGVLAPSTEYSSYRSEDGYYYYYPSSIPFINAGDGTVRPLKDVERFLLNYRMYFASQGSRILIRSD